MAALSLLLVVAAVLCLHAWFFGPSLPAARMRTWIVHPGNRSLVTAVVVAFVVRLAWSIATTKATAVPITDPGRYITTAEQLSRFHLPTWHGTPTAGNAIGYPILLAPFFWLSHQVGAPSAVFTAALLNVVLGTINVGLVAAIGATWFGRSTRNLAAWLLAVGPAQIYFTSVAMTETFYATLVLSCVLAATLLVIRAGDDKPSKGWSIGFGALAGWAALVNPGGTVLVLVPGLALRGLRGSWRPFTTRLGMILIGAAMVTVPVALRNGLQVGVWTPMATSTSFQACMGHWEGANGTATLGPTGLVHCYTRDPNQDFAEWLAHPPKESEVYYRNYREAMRYAWSHPRAEVRLFGQKLWVTMKNDHEALEAAQDFGRHQLAGPSVGSLLRILADTWYALVMLLVVIGLACIQACRRAVPLWAVPVMLLLGINLAHGSPRYHHAAVALLSVLAAHTLVTTWDRLIRRRSAPRKTSRPEGVATSSPGGLA